MEKLIKKILRENRQLLKESCTCYTANPVGGGPMLVYDLCQQGTQAASCSCCCQAWLHPTYVDQQECLTTSVAPPNSGDDNELGLYSNDFLTVDDSDTGGGGTGFIERDNKRANILVPKGGGKSSMKDRLMNEGPICGDKGGKPCGNCGDGYTWTDSYVTNSCICNHSGGAVCHSTGSGMYSDNGDILAMDDLYIPDGLKNKGKGDKAIDSLRHVKLESKSKKTTNMKRNITKTDLKRIVGKVLSEHPLPPPNHLHTHSNCQACDCFFDMTWSQGHQYGGHVEMEGCMQPAGGKLTLYVNNVMQYSSTSLVGTNSSSITWGNAQTAIIRVKAVMECYGSHPSCSAENVEKTICVRKSDGQKVPCRKTMPKGELMKHDDSKALGVNLGDNDVELESPYDSEDIRESRLNFIIKKTLRETTKVLNEAPGCSPGDCPTGMYCSFSGPHLQSSGKGTCIDGAPPSPFPWGGKTDGGGGKRPTVRRHDADMAKRKPNSAKARDMRGSRKDKNVRMESLITKTLRETVKQLNEAPNCYYRRRNYANSGYTCVARKCGFSGSNKAFYPGEFGSMDDCNALVIPTGTPKGVNTALNTRNFS
tara:strand:+ start:20 stop:1798 length:1779 start_codon:yes stop_codon:yes gene_type:complete